MVQIYSNLPIKKQENDIGSCSVVLLDVFEYALSLPFPEPRNLSKISNKNVPEMIVFSTPSKV